MSVGTALRRAAVRYTVTRTRLFRPAGDTGNVTSPGVTLTCCPTTSFWRAAVSALCTAGPDADRLL